MPQFRETPVDDPAAHALIAEYLAMRADTFPPELGAYAPTFPHAAEFVPPTGVFLVVTDANADIGCGGVRLLPAVEGDGSTRFELKHLWIRPAEQGDGLGRALLVELERRAIGFGATEIVLDTNASLIAAGRLYRSSGYRSIPPYNENPNATDWYSKTIP